MFEVRIKVACSDEVKDKVLHVVKSLLSSNVSLGQAAKHILYYYKTRQNNLLHLKCDTGKGNRDKMR